MRAIHGYINRNRHVKEQRKREDLSSFHLSIPSTSRARLNDPI
jgi:hypothetical protein